MASRFANAMSTHFNRLRPTLPCWAFGFPLARLRCSLGVSLPNFIGLFLALALLSRRLCCIVFSCVWSLRLPGDVGGAMEKGLASDEFHR